MLAAFMERSRASGMWGDNVKGPDRPHRPRSTQETGMRCSPPGSIRTGLKAALEDGPLGDQDGSLAPNGHPQGGDLTGLVDGHSAAGQGLIQEVVVPAV